jgi:AcrR family transcriptional regulator
LVDAGVELLAEGGWPAVTARSVAERAGANPGLIHYHWGGLPPLKLAIARRAGELVFGPFALQLLDATCLQDVYAQLAAMVAPPTEAATTRLTVELVAGAVRDPALGDVLRESLHRTRRTLAGWLATHQPDAPPGTATLLVALLDGLLLHHTLDPVSDPVEAVRALAGLTSAPVAPPGTAGHGEAHGGRDRPAAEAGPQRDDADGTRVRRGPGDLPGAPA